MAFVKFIGKAHVRILGAGDLKPLGAENFSKTEFRRGESVEVPDNVAELLTTHPALSNQFAKSEAPLEPGEVTGPTATKR